MTTFAEKYAPKYDKAADCLLKDRDALLAFFDFPPSMGRICGHRIRLKAPLRRFAIARCA